jgi:hypothetical protein
VVINGVSYQFPNPLDGIALTPDLQTVYYCALGSNKLYSIPAAALRNFSTSDADLGALVTYHGAKLSASDGLTFDANGIL